MSTKQQYHLRKIEGGAPRRVWGAREGMTRDGHALVVQTSESATASSNPDAMWIKDLRRGRRHIWGGMLRYLDFLHRRGVALDVALTIPRLLEEFVRQIWADKPAPAVAVPVTLLRTGDIEREAA